MTFNHKNRKDLKKNQMILQKMYPELFIIIGAKKNSNIIWLENNDLSSTSGNLFSPQ